MRKVFLSIMIGLVASALASGATLCTDLLTVNVLTPGFGCELGGVTFSAFGATNAGSAPNPMQVNLTGASVTNGTVFLTFNPNLFATQTLSADMYFYFTVTGGVVGVDLYNGGSAGTSIQEVVCSQAFDNPTISPACTGGTYLANMTAGTLENKNFYFAPPGDSDGVIYVWKDILAQPTEGHISSFTQSFHTPEPMTFVLIGTGLLGLGVLGRRRAGK